MSADAFLDTNIFIYQLEGLDRRKATIARSLIRRSFSAESGCISFQVVQECMNTIVRKAELPLSAAEAKSYLDDVLAPLWRVMPSGRLYRVALDTQERYRYGFYDSLIIAAALEAGCKTLYSEDLQHGQRIGQLTIENPFLDE